MRQGVFTLRDARSFFGLTSKIPPLGSMFFLTLTSRVARRQRVCADVKPPTATHISAERIPEAFRCEKVHCNLFDFIWGLLSGDFTWNPSLTPLPP